VVCQCRTRGAGTRRWVGGMASVGCSQ